ncbi:leucine-rich repeat domain-containing protein [Candidatus Peregrinibacteria bacterium]|nr:leucine-rich repeat domain-containing protein [Candidatus Peregrinibacteria bacterium]
MGEHYRIRKSPSAKKRLKLCHQLVCNVATGEFSEVSNADGTVCNDQKSYTSNDKCQSGICKGTPINPCDPDGDGIITDKFKDSNFLAAAGATLGGASGSAYITLQDALKATSLDVGVNGIEDISGIECFSNLKDLILSNNYISDLTPLKNLTNLVYLDLWNNKISNVTPLAGLTKLQELTIGYQKELAVISDITPLAGLTNLTRLELPDNEISDITPLAGLANLKYLTLTKNKISDIAPLADLNKLEFLYLDKNQISDVTSLGGLINLYILSLKSNLIQDITALINNPGIGNLEIGLIDYVCLLGNPQISQSQMNALANKGVDIICQGSI